MEVEDGGIPEGDTDEDALILPETLAETEDMIVELTGTVIEIKQQLANAQELNRLNLEVNWAWYRRAQRKLAYSVGDLGCLKTHRSMLIDTEKRAAAAGRPTREQLVAANLAKQDEILTKAIRSREEKMARREMREMARERGKRKVIYSFVKERFPSVMDELHEVLSEFERKFDQENPP